MAFQINSLMKAIKDARNSKNFGRANRLQDVYNATKNPKFRQKYLEFAPEDQPFGNSVITDEGADVLNKRKARMEKLYGDLDSRISNRKSLEQEADKILFANPEHSTSDSNLYDEIVDKVANNKQLVKDSWYQFDEDLLQSIYEKMLSNGYNKRMSEAFKDYYAPIDHGMSDVRHIPTKGMSEQDFMHYVDNMFNPKNQRNYSYEDYIKDMGRNKNDAIFPTKIDPISGLEDTKNTYANKFKKFADEFGIVTDNDGEINHFDSYDVLDMLQRGHGKAELDPNAENIKDLFDNYFRNEIPDVMLGKD